MKPHRALTMYINATGRLCTDNLRGLFDVIEIIYLPFGIVVFKIVGTQN